MKKHVYILIILVLLVCTAVPSISSAGRGEEAAEEEAIPETTLQAEDLETLEQQFSYAFGYLSAMGFIQEGIDLELDAFTMAVADVYTEEDPLLEFEEMRHIFEAYRRGRYSKDELHEHRPAEHGLDTLKAQFSYSFGYLSSVAFYRQGFDLDVDIFSQSVRDAYAGEEPVLTVEQMNEALMDYQLAIREQMHKEQEQLAASNLAEAQDFLEENAQRDGVATTDSGLQYEVIEQGEGEYPEADDTVTVHYTGSLLDGTIFDSSREREEPVTFLLAEVIPGWVEGLQLMREGSTFKLFLHPDLGYGTRGVPPHIGPNELLTFEVELIEIE